jgi:acetyl esterase/lipase
MALAIGIGGASSAETKRQEVVDIWPGQAPGTSDWSGPEFRQPITLPGVGTFEMVTNVTTPTLTVYRPAPGKANGSAVIICPGGSFQILAWDMEGTEVAQWLADRGVTAFVLKYRVRGAGSPPPTPQGRPDVAAFDKHLPNFRPGWDIATADGRQAVRFLRTNAARFEIAPDRIGMMGFSAGAMTTMSVAMSDDPAIRPDFVASIYGAADDVAPPSDAPPLFIAAAQDDMAVPVAKSLMLFSRWNAADRPAELHVYERGGHGFGMRRHETTVDGWPAAFELWLKTHGWIGTGAVSN